MGRREKERAARKRVQQRAAKAAAANPNLLPLAPPTPSAEVEVKRSWGARVIAKAPRSVFLVTSLLLILSSIAGMHAANPRYDREPQFLLAAALLVSAAWIFFFWISTARAVTARLGLPVALLTALLIGGYLVGAITQNVLDGRPVLVGSELNAAVEYTRKLDSIGEALRKDQEKYLLSGDLEGAVLIDEMPAAALRWSETSAELVRISRSNEMPDLSWRGATLTLAESADLLSKAINRRVDALGNLDPRAGADVAVYSSQIDQTLSGAWQLLREQAVRSGVEKPNTGGE